MLKKPILLILLLMASLTFEQGVPTAKAQKSSKEKGQWVDPTRFFRFDQYGEDLTQSQMEKIMFDRGYHIVGFEVWQWGTFSVFQEDTYYDYEEINSSIRNYGKVTGLGAEDPKHQKIFIDTPVTIDLINDDSYVINMETLEKAFERTEIVAKNLVFHFDDKSHTYSFSYTPAGSYQYKEPPSFDGSIKQINANDTGASSILFGFTNETGMGSLGGMWICFLNELKDPKTSYSDQSYQKHYLLLMVENILLEPPVEGDWDYQVKSVRTMASDEEGEDEGEDIPWTFIIIGGLAVGGAAAVAVSKGGKGKDKDKEKEWKPSTFKMILYKDFGDTLFEGDKPKTVGARIEEITPEGEKIERPDLTAKIIIYAEENCEVSRSVMSGRYMASRVSATKVIPFQPDRLAKLCVSFTGPAGMLVNHVTFKIGAAPEIVIGEALTFEAEGGKTQFIEFGINNYVGTVLSTKVEIEEAGKQYFTAKILPDGYLPLKYRINVTEHGKLPETQPKEQQQKKTMAGDADCFTCTLTVTLDGREEPLVTTFDLYRFQLGVRLDVRPLKAYLVTRDSTYKEETLPLKPDVEKKYGESRVAFKLYVADEKTGQVRAVLPDKEPVFVFQDIMEPNLVFMDRDGNTVTDLCKHMDFKYGFDHVDDDNTVVGVLRSSGGGLMPPNRSKAMVTLKVSYHGQEYEDYDVVPIISQPYRHIDDDREYSRALKEDERKLDQLMDIRRKMLVDPMFAELLPFYYKVDTLIETYDAKFGIYEPDYEKMMRVFDKYCRGEIGNAFVNEEVFTPNWTFTDECFNALMATYAPLEKSAKGIAFRIALGFVTFGASEIVFTPLGAVNKMKEYIDKGDSGLKAFALASLEVVFWEGVFYVGGEVLKWGGGKAKELAKSKGWDTKIKDAFVKLKDSLVPVKQSKQAAKQLASAKGVSTKNIGEQIVEAGKKVSSTKKTTVTKANDAIRKTRQMGDKVFTEQSRLMEECAKEARKDARKIMDNFTEVISNPNATPEEIRRATLAVQGNKSAQDLLKSNMTDTVRARFNAEMKKIYKEVDGPTIKKLAGKLKVKESEIRVAPNASGNADDALALGKKIGADRDVTFQVRGKDGKWIDIDEDIMEQAYCEAFNEYHYGFMPADRKEALKTLEKFDQSVVHGETGLESYGKDLPNIIKKEFQSNKLIDPEKVADAYKYKCEMWFNRGKEAKEQAEKLMKMGFPEEAMKVMGYGEKLIEEGVRQNVKQFQRILDPRIQALATKGIKGKDYALLYEKVHVLESIGIPPPKNVLPATLEEVRLTLQTQYNTTIEKVVEECAGMIKEVNALL